MVKTLSEMTLDELWEIFPIELREHDPAYKDWYTQEKKAIVNALGECTVLRINHIGSTAVEGLLAKPVVDILLEVKSHANLNSLKETLINIGWNLMAQEVECRSRITFNKGYTPDGYEDKVFHLHLHHIGDCEELYFRDYLREYTHIAEDYARLKKELAKKYLNDRDEYTRRKGEFVVNHTQLSRFEFDGRY